MIIFDSSGIEAWVTENNPKYANRIIKRLKAYAKSKSFDDSFDPYKVAYASIPSHSAANPEIKQLYIDGHFCYAYKIEIVQMASASFDTSISTTKLSLRSILKLPLIRNPILRMRTNPA